ncbi:GNAT family N-acetyltransferase [Herbihabitans rhizosphaerae]|uniref:GNAT family N-acetyltransferase n=1 Tax=Herbihabitans rhizosphaerae TaxID=1872711 RepID=UPI001A93A372|nr:GNAT family N-acetyltransferase [Herbihabitans rhizosphaerae]
MPTPLNPQTVLERLDDQLRRNARTARPEVRIERADRVVREIGPSWCGILWSDLDEQNADGVIAEQAAYFAGLDRSWEWKHYAHDRPADLPARLAAAGLTPEGEEALMIAEANALPEFGVPDGIELVLANDDDGIRAAVDVHEEVFGGDHTAIEDALLAQRATAPDTLDLVLALADGKPVSACRSEYELGTDFVGLWGGGTLPEWRGRGIYRAMVTFRAKRAIERGFRYLRVDAMPDSRPILARNGFTRIGTTTPYVS